MFGIINLQQILRIMMNIWTNLFYCFLLLFHMVLTFSKFKKQTKCYKYVSCSSWTKMIMEKISNGFEIVIQIRISIYKSEFVDGYLNE